MTIEKDESINKREVIVNFLAFHVCDMIKLAALSEAGIEQAPNVTIKLELKMKNRDNLGYERDTESLAEGARVITTVDRDWKAPEPDPVDYAPKPYNDPPVEPQPDVKARDEIWPDNGRDHPQPKRDRAGRIKD